MSELPKVGSVWGVVGDTESWRQIAKIENGYIRCQWFWGRSEAVEESTWEEYCKLFGLVDINAIVNERDELAAKLEFLRSKGLTVGTMQESGKGPYLAYVIEPGSELCDLEVVNKLVDAEVRADKYESALKELYAAIELGGLDLSCCMDCGAPVVCIPDGLPMCEGCAGKAVETGSGLPELTDAECERMNAMPSDIVKRLWDKGADLSQPYTVEWLCEIGGADCGESIAFRDANGWLLLEFFIGTREWWIYNQAEIPKDRQPKTRGDVLKWLDVLGIVPATTKGGDK